MNPVARVRHLLARRPWLYWLAVAALATGVGAIAAHAVAGVEDARQAWGATTDVMVAISDIAPGEPVADHVETHPRPGPMVPAAAVADIEPGAVARQHISAGEIVVAPDLAAGGAPQSLIPRGWRGVAVAEVVPSGASVGDAVAAVSGGLELAPEGIVVAQTVDAVVVAVPEDAAAQVAHAAASGELSLLLVP